MSDPNKSTALIPYTQPDVLTGMERAILIHGTMDERYQVIRNAMIRELGVSSSVILGSEDGYNYSSMAMYRRRKSDKAE